MLHLLASEIQKKYIGDIVMTMLLSCLQCQRCISFLLFYFFFLLIDAVPLCVSASPLKSEKAS